VRRRAGRWMPFVWAYFLSGKRSALNRGSERRKGGTRKGGGPFDCLSGGGKNWSYRGHRIEAKKKSLTFGKDYSFRKGKSGDG